MPGACFIEFNVDVTIHVRKFSQESCRRLPGWECAQRRRVHADSSAYTSVRGRVVISKVSGCLPFSLVEDDFTVELQQNHSAFRLPSAVGAGFRSPGLLPSLRCVEPKCGGVELHHWSALTNGS